MITAAFGILWYQGFFLPGWINWEDGSITSQDVSFELHNRKLTAFYNGSAIWKLESKYKAQSILVADIDRDGAQELLVLCWRIGRYGYRKPFWVKRNEAKWSQHIYIYNIEDGAIKPQWMASDIGKEVASWTIPDKYVLENTAPDGKVSDWIWNSWGLERLPDGYAAIKERVEAKSNSEDIGTDAEAEINSDENPIENSTDNLDEKSEDESVEEADEVLGDDADNSLSIIMVGDILLHEGVVASCKTDDGYDFSTLFSNTESLIAAADIAIANQEVILGGEELRITGYPSFNGPYEVADALAGSGFDVVCHGTNHALDRGKKGIINCLNYWRDNYPQINVLGIYDSEEEYDKVCIVEVNDIKIAILNYTYGTNGIPLPSDMPYAVKYLDEELILKELAYAEENADFTIVCPHWGIEYQLAPSELQKSEAKMLAENGADLIIGTHPHVIEPVEWIEANNNKALCYYSLGNYINWTSGRGRNIANRMVGGMAQVSIEDRDGIVAIKDYNVIPMIAHIEHERGKVTTYPINDYDEELADNNAIIEQDSEFSYEYCQSLCDEIWGDLWHIN